MLQPVRVLLVDDYAPIREFVRSLLHRRHEIQVVAEVADGLEAVVTAQALNPDLILLDIGLPTVNGIEAARRIRQVSPESKIIMLTELHAWSFAEEALRCGASGYVVKSDAAGELLQAVDAVFKGGEFVSSSIAGRNVAATGMDHERRHEAGFFSDDQLLLDHVTEFVGAHLEAGNSAIVLATEPHRKGILQRLAESRFDVARAFEQRRYFALDADDLLSHVMVKGKFDPARCWELSGVLEKASEVSRGPQGRVGLYGECVNILCARGNTDAAIDMESAGNQLFDRFNVHILCGYSVSGLHPVMDGPVFQCIRDLHSAVHFH